MLHCPSCLQLENCIAHSQCVAVLQLVLKGVLPPRFLVLSMACLACSEGEMIVLCWLLLKEDFQINFFQLHGS